MKKRAFLDCFGSVLMLVRQKPTHKPYRTYRNHLYGIRMHDFEHGFLEHCFQNIALGDFSFYYENYHEYQQWIRKAKQKLQVQLSGVTEYLPSMMLNIKWIPMGTNCAPLVADLFLFWNERDFMMSLSDDKQADVIDAFNTTSRYLDDILNINNVYFENMVSQIYPSELQLNKANASDTEAAFLDLHLSISNDIVSTKIYDKRDDFDFEIVNFPFLDGDVPRSTSYGVYISQLIRFARASSYVTDFNTRNKLLTQKLLKQGYRYHKLRKTFSKFYRRYYDLISKFQVGLKSLLRQGLSEPDFYGDLVFKLKKIVGSNNFSAQFIKIISHYKKIGYNINVLQQTA